MNDKQSTAVDEHEMAMAVADVLRDAAGYREWLVSPLQAAFYGYSLQIQALHLPADDEANALARLREVLGIAE